MQAASPQKLVGGKEVVGSLGVDWEIQSRRRSVAEEIVSSLHKIQMLVVGGKGKEVCVSQDKVSSSQEGDAVENDVFSFDREDVPNVLGVAKEGSISLFKIFKWVFHMLNMTNVRVRGAMSKVGESLVQTQVDELYDSMNIVVDTATEEMLKMKQAFEKRILTLEEQMERIIVKLDKGVYGTNSAMRYESKGLSTTFEKENKCMEITLGEEVGAGEWQVEEEVSVDKATSSQNVLIDEVNMIGPGARI